MATCKFYFFKKRYQVFIVTSEVIHYGLEQLISLFFCSFLYHSSRRLKTLFTSFKLSSTLSCSVEFWVGVVALAACFFWSFAVVSWPVHWGDKDFSWEIDGCLSSLPSLQILPGLFKTSFLLLFGFVCLWYSVSFSYFYQVWLECFWLKCIAWHYFFI